MAQSGSLRGELRRGALAANAVAGLLAPAAQAAEPVAPGHAGMSVPLSNLSKEGVSSTESAVGLPEGASAHGLGLRLRASESLFLRTEAALYGGQPSDTSTSALAVWVGGGAEYHYRNAGPLSPYVAVYGGVLFISSADAPPTVGVFGGAAGVEFFVAPNLSLATEYRVEAAFQGEAAPVGISSGGSGLLINLYY